MLLHALNMDRLQEAMGGAICVGDCTKAQCVFGLRLCRQIRGLHAGMCFVVGPVHSLNGVRVHGRLLPVVRRAGISQWCCAAV